MGCRQTLLSKKVPAWSLENKAAGGGGSQKGWWTGKLESINEITYIICRGQHKMKMCCNSRALTLVWALLSVGPYMTTWVTCPSSWSWALRNQGHSMSWSHHVSPGLPVCSSSNREHNPLLAKDSHLGFLLCVVHNWCSVMILPILWMERLMLRQTG